MDQQSLAEQPRPTPLCVQAIIRTTSSRSIFHDVEPLQWISQTNNNYCLAKLCFGSLAVDYRFQGSAPPGTQLDPFPTQPHHHGSRLLMRRSDLRPHYALVKPCVCRHRQRGGWAEREVETSLRHLESQPGSAVYSSRFLNG